MGWFAAVDRDNHPCRVPLESEVRQHRRLEFWRCEVCNDLFQLRSQGYTGHGMVRVTNWWTRWRYRKQGYTKGDRYEPV